VALTTHRITDGATGVDPDTEGSKESISDRIVIVTGAGTGIGRGIAIRLLREGYQCVLVGPVESHLQDTITEAAADETHGAVAVADIRSAGDRTSLLSLVDGLPGQVYGLVNNAGVAYSTALLDEAESDWHNTLTTNVVSSQMLSLLAADRMRELGRGRIVNIASIRGFRAMNNDDYGAWAPTASSDDRGPTRMTAYAASKAAIIQLSRDLAAAMGEWNITVNSVSPGLIRHESYDQHSLREERSKLGRDPLRQGLGQPLQPEVEMSLEKRIPLRRVGSVEDIAGPVAFLLSDDAAYVSGANLVVDGGWTVW
jgi:NAD(P)-dependent dehydrogenase (short-subunit alcohol dehydrogenase family)